MSNNRTGLIFDSTIASVADRIARVQADSVARRQHDEKFALDLAAAAATHEDWIVVVRFGLAQLASNPALLLSIIGTEAAREVERGAASTTEALAKMLAELGLTVSARSEA